MCISFIAKFSTPAPPTPVAQMQWYGYRACALKWCANKDRYTQSPQGVSPIKIHQDQSDYQLPLVLSFSCLRSCLSLSPIWSGMLCPPRWSCLSLVSGLVSQLVPSGLRCCVRLPGLVFFLSPVLSLSLSSIWSDAFVTLSFSFLRPCLSACLPSGLGCYVHLPGLVFLFVCGLVSHLVWDAVSAPLVLSLVLSPIWSAASMALSFSLVCGLVSRFVGMLCPPRCSCFSLVSDLVSQLVSRLGFCVRLLGLVFLSRGFTVGVVHAFLMCMPCLECCIGLVGLAFLLFLVWSPTLSSGWSGALVSFLVVSHVVSHLVWVLCPPSWLVSQPACLQSWLPPCLPAGPGCCVCALGLSPKFNVRFVQLFGVYGGVISNLPDVCSRFKFTDQFLTTEREKSTPQIVAQVFTKLRTTWGFAKFANNTLDCFVDKCLAQSHGKRQNKASSHSLPRTHSGGA